MDFPSLDQEFPSLDQDFPYFESVESLISLTDSRLAFLVFPIALCQIFVFIVLSFFLISFCILRIIWFFCLFFTWFYLFLFLFSFALFFKIPLHLSLPPPFHLPLPLNIPPSQFEVFILNFAFTSYDIFLELLEKIVPFRLKTADLLFLGRDDVYKRAVISGLSDEDERITILMLVLSRRTFGDFLIRRRRLETPYSRASVIGGIKFNLSDFGELQTACRLWKDYCAKRDAVVYIVNADTERNMEQFSEAREDLNKLLTDEDFENVPFLIICTTADPSASEEELCNLLGLTADPSASEEELCNLLGLTNMTTGKGRVNLAGRNARPLEVFVYDRFNERHLDAIKWLSQHIK